MQEINTHHIGAQFVRADLHIHSYGVGGSYDVTDVSNIPQNIVDTAIAKGLKIIAITDHNEIENARIAIEYSLGKEILVIPGIEISTIQGHLLVYFETYEQLRRFHGKLNIAANKETCTQGIVDCLNLAAEYNGIGILAHIELSSGFEKTIGRFGPPIEQIINHSSLFALEISNKANINLYSDFDDNPDRKRLIATRRQTLDLPHDYDFPKIMSSDSHTLARLGTNADGENKLTRIKVDDLNFHAFKVALISHTSRIRLENLVPERIPKFIGMKINGGLLDREIVRFSPNLTCIIGGRGAGKSTLLESLRETSGNRSEARVVDSEIWPQQITLYFEDEVGQVHQFSREKNAGVFNVVDPSNGIVRIPIESYGQGETAETIQHSDQNPKILLDFLDSFIDISALIAEDEEIRLEIINNQSEINILRIDVAGIDEAKRLKANLDNKLAILEKDRVGELVTYQIALMRERDLRNRLLQDLRTLVDTFKNVLSNKSLFEAFEKLTDNDIIVGKDNFAAVKSIVADIAALVATKEVELNTGINEKIGLLSTQIQGWNGKEKEIQDKIDAKRQELDAQGIPFDLGRINQLIGDVGAAKQRLELLESKSGQLVELLKVRRTLIDKRKGIKNRIFYTRQQFSTVINDNLKNSVDGFYVHVEFKQGKYSPQFEELVKSCMDWRTTQVPRTRYLSNAMSPLEFTEGLSRRNLTNLVNVVDSDGGRIFGDDEIARIIARCTADNNNEDFESLEFEDLPIITVTKLVPVEGGPPQRVTKRLSHLSLGQQQSILLAILLQSKSKAPLIIDQPEDNLDSEFIYKSIVTNLRRIKEQRQVIIVTHNANIAVLGDAELIIPLKSTSVKSTIMERGSIDRPGTRDACCDILEGGKRAFNRRKEIYGLN